MFIMCARNGLSVSKGSKDGGVFNLKLFAMLGCFHVEVYDDQRSIADIRVQGRLSFSLFAFKSSYCDPIYNLEHA